MFVKLTLVIYCASSVYKENDIHALCAYDFTYPKYDV